MSNRLVPVSVALTLEQVEWLDGQEPNRSSFIRDILDREKIRLDGYSSKIEKAKADRVRLLEELQLIDVKIESLKDKEQERVSEQEHQRKQRLAERFSR